MRRGKKLSKSVAQVCLTLAWSLGALECKLHLLSPTLRQEVTAFVSLYPSVFGHTM